MDVEQQTERDGDSQGEAVGEEGGADAPEGGSPEGGGQSDDDGAHDQPVEEPPSSPEPTDPAEGEVAAAAAAAANPFEDETEEILGHLAAEDEIVQRAEEAAAPDDLAADERNFFLSSGVIMAEFGALLEGLFADAEAAIDAREEREAEAACAWSRDAPFSDAAWQRPVFPGSRTTVLGYCYTYLEVSRARRRRPES